MKPVDVRAGADAPFRAPPSGGPDLIDSMRRARIEDAERSKAVAELRGAEIARLQMLHDLLKPVFAELPRDADLFDHGLVAGERPRLYVDMLAFVEMGHDRRIYRFMQDTRRGRIVIAETDGVNLMALAVTEYLARRLVEREKMLSSELARVAGPPREAPPKRPVAAAAKPAPAMRAGMPDQVISFLSGMVAGAGAVFLYAWWATGKFAPALRALGF